MAGPITWRNVGSTVSPGGSGSRRQYEGGSAQPLLAAIGDIIQNQQQLSASNSKVIRENNTQDYLDTVANASLEQLQNPEFAAGLQQQIAGPESGVNREVARGAVEQRVQNLQKQAITTQAFQDVEQERNERGMIDNIRTWAANGETDKIAEAFNTHDFLNEGKYRDEIAKVGDDAQQRIYRANDEKRAEANADRAVQSHNLGMLQGQENLNYSRELHQEARDTRQGLKTADATVNSLFDNYEISKANTNEFLGNVGRDLGLRPDQFDAAGLPDASKMTAEEKDNYNQRIRDAGMDPTLSDTQLRNDVIEQTKNLPPVARKAALDQLEYKQSLSGLAPADQAKAEAAAAAVNAPLDQALQKKNQDYEIASKRNFFLQPDPDPLGVVNKAMADLTASDYGTQSDRENIRKSLVDYATNGLSIKDNGPKVPVPSGIIELAVATRPVGTVWDTEDAIKDTIITLMGSPEVAAMRQEAPDLRNNFLKDTNALNLQKQSNATKALRSFQATRGVNINPNDILMNAVDRR